MTTSLFFGPADAPMHAVHHPASPVDGSPPGVLLLNPFGEEALRSFRAFKLLAERLARRGSPTLRFDYAATGDSAGACEDARLPSFCTSAVEAEAELRLLSGARRVVWVGLRLGASVAAMAAQSAAQPPAGLVLWDPIVDGRAYLQTLARDHAALLQSAFDLPEPAAAARGLDADGHPTEALGFPISKALRTDFEALDLTTLTARPGRKIVIVSDAADDGLAAHLTALGAKVDVLEPGDAGGWNSDEAMNAYVTPRATLERIAERIGAWR